ncbi:MAG: hypothetical protein DWI26_07630 [Planctomycetota bacterium]|nr:MAG: hypothetical protein DWI26_07630 [Planctomycetota bacterium]
MANCLYRQIDIWIFLGKIGFEWISAHADGFLKAVGRKPSGERSSAVFQSPFRGTQDRKKSQSRRVKTGFL